MRISTRARYGMQAMLALALDQGAGPLSIKEIAERRGLPEHYLEQLITPLRRASLVLSARGAQGGYVLARPASTITLLEIVEAVEGPFAVEECGCPAGAPHLHGFCLEHAVWTKLKQAVDACLGGRTLADLRDEALAVGRAAVPLYDI